MENIWNSPESSSVNRLPMLNVEHPTAISLDGTWNFQLIAHPNAPLGNWQKLNVPGLWTIVDGASVFTHYWSVILPLLRPPLAALSVLMTTWIYNEFFWAIVLMKTDAKRPITAALGRLRGEYITDFNMLAAGAIMAALPTLIIFFVMKKQFVSGLTIGSTKG